MDEEQRAEFKRDNQERTRLGITLLTEDEFIFLWELDEQWNDAKARRIRFLKSN